MNPDVGKKQLVTEFLDEMYDILSESIDEPAGSGCGYGITEQGKVAIEVELFSLLRKLGVIE